MNEPIQFPTNGDDKVIKDGDLAKVQAVFPDKFVFLYVADKTTKRADLAGCASTPEDVRLFRILLHRVTLGDNGKPKGSN